MESLRIPEIDTGSCVPALTAGTPVGREIGLSGVKLPTWVCCISQMHEVLKAIRRDPSEGVTPNSEASLRFRFRSFSASLAEFSCQSAISLLRAIYCHQRLPEQSGYAPPPLQRESGEHGSL